MRYGNGYVMIFLRVLLYWRKLNKMKHIIWFIFMGSTIISADSYFSLKGLKEYNSMVSNYSRKLTLNSSQTLEEMKMMSKSLKIIVKKDSSKTLFFNISDVSIGNDIGLKINLELAEFFNRDNNEVLGITYFDSQIVLLSSEINDDVLDIVEEMLEKFKNQYISDNNFISNKQVKHANFVNEMQYETNYEEAVKKAKIENKELFILITSNYCPWCRKLESNILGQQTVADRINKYFVPLFLDISNSVYPKELYDSSITPAIYIVNPKTKNIEEKFIGYSNRKLLLEFLLRKGGIK
ncbi:MAG TPA: thioredoxin family protein [Flavobacteriaceae bacterium]|nr:thioredoxin family protein [Flavobacteriaceae bacterium]